MSNDNDEKGEHANQTYMQNIFILYARENSRICNKALESNKMETFLNAFSFLHFKKDFHNFFFSFYGFTRINKNYS